MRDINRIKPFLEKFEELWEKYPDWRFGQLVVNMFGNDPFYIEDEQSLERIEKHLESLEKKA